MNSSGQRKAEIRRALRQQRAQVPPARRRHFSHLASLQLLRSRALLKARCVALYLHHGSELETTALIAALQARGVRVVVPRIESAPGRMHMVMLTRGFSRLRSGPFGIAQSITARRCPLRAIDVLLMPLIAYDLRGHRLGSGGGYYDRWLSRCRGPRPRRIGLAFSAQCVSQLPTEPWDVRLHAISTERGVHYFSHPALSAVDAPHCADT